MSVTGRVDLDLIAGMVEPGSRVLDIGCGDGVLLEALVAKRGCHGRGVELSQAGVNACVARGLSVIQGNADTDLADFPDQAFDYAILSQTLQATREPKRVLEDLARIGKRAIVSFPNFGHWRVRFALAWTGRMPMTSALAEPWHSTPNIHFCTVRDFVDLAADCGLSVDQALTVRRSGQAEPITALGWANLFGEQAVFSLRRAG
jgi:methionine biosynthesis protein MetW